MNQNEKALKKVIKVITDTMKKTNTTVSMLAKRTEKESHNIYRILNKKRNITILTLSKILNAMGKAFEIRVFNKNKRSKKWNGIK